MVGTQSGYHVPSSQNNDASPTRCSKILIKSQIPYVKSSGEPGLRWPKTMTHSKFSMRYKTPILFAIGLTAALLLLTISIGYLLEKSDDDSPQLDIEKLMDKSLRVRYDIFQSDNEIKSGGTEELLDQVTINYLEEPENPEIRIIRKREAPNIFGWRNSGTFLPGTAKLQRVETGSKFPRETEIISGNENFLKKMDAAGKTNLRKRGIEMREKLGVCKRSVEECKAVLQSMHSLAKTANENVNSLNKMLDQIKFKEQLKNTDPLKFQKFMQCVECNKITNDDSIRFVDDSEVDETAAYNHPVFHSRQSQMSNALTIAQMLNNPKSISSDIGKRTIEATAVDDNLYEYPTAWIETNLNDPNIRKTVDIATVQNKTEDMEVTYIIKNTTIIKHLPKVESREELPQPENIQIGMPTVPSLLFNTPRREENFGWGEATRSPAVVEDPSTTITPTTTTTTTTTAPKLKYDSNWFQESPRRNIQSGARIATGPQRQPAKGFYDGSSVMFPTAETTKTSQQVQFTPPVSWTPYPVCFFGSPNSNGPTGATIRQPMNFPASSPAGFPFTTNQFSQRGLSYAAPPMAQGFGPMQYPQQFPYGNPAPGFQQVPYMGPTAPGGQGFFQNFGNGPTAPGAVGRAPYYCTFMSAPTYQLPTQPGVAEFQRNEDYPSAIVSGRDKSLDSEQNPQKENVAELNNGCGKDERRCKDGSRCVSKTSWCDIKVDCPDASDEAKCSCRARVYKDRICDGYFDCPLGEDELGCFGCPINSFSCKDWSQGDGIGEECVPLSQRCDGSKQCPNGKDEEDCSKLTASIVDNENLNIIGYTVGYLHRNWQGRWYPACTLTESWAVEACVAETGFPLRDQPRMEMKSAPEYSGLHSLELGPGNIAIVPKCHNRVVYVKCPQIPCGTRVISRQELESPFGRNEDSILRMENNSTSSSNSTNNVIDQILRSIRYAQTSESMNAAGSEIVGAESRVVGGKASQPKAWPFLVAIHKNGYFSCGGIIINENWILTAAHCVDGFTINYYEVQAGVLRRFSFSPTGQTRRVDLIKMHPYYDRTILKSDLALMKLDEPLLFNRWVRPACLPKMWLTESSLRTEPLFDATCVTAGWGALFEHGPDPDHLREVAVPITRQCKHPEDRNDGEFCAGLPQGGLDACQGDSGGPFMCNFPDSENQWYVAGIVSHGEGCGRPNEPGAYTKVSHFVDWINSVIVSAENGEAMISGPKPLASCPGFLCNGGLGKCLPARSRCNGVADCLDAEDEINCVPTLFTGQPNAFENDTGSHDREYVGQSNQAARDEIVFNIKTPAFVNHESWISPSPTEVDNENTSTIVTTMATTSEATLTTDSSTTEESITVTISSRPFPANYVEQAHFTCTRITQSLRVDQRCNRIIDCEDGTDEDNCTCKDYLANLHPKAICNGYVDCDDRSDEENCAFCRANEFTCTRSGTCIPESKLCDQKVDCDNMEDELDCFALTNGDQVIVDFDRRPQLNLEGVVTKWENRTWRPLCVNQDTNLLQLSNKFCEYFGFGSAEYSEKITVRGAPIKVKESTKNSVYPYEYSPSFKPPKKNVKTCNGVYVRCKSILSANTNHLVVTNPLNTNIDYLWPWQASIFADGRYRCPGTLLDHSWLLVTSRCIENLELERNYTMAVVGTAPTYLYVNGPFQQISLIDSIRPIKNLDAALLHLQIPVNHTRYVQPIFVQRKIFPPTNKDDCIATGVNKKYETNTTFLQPVPESCPFCHRCYKNATLENCANGTLTNWSGTIVCRGSGFWYPAAMFNGKDMFCGFQNTQVVSSIDYGNALLTEIMEGNLETVTAPSCNGFRCPFGKCLSWDRVCNGVDDCRDRSDENADYCQKRKEECRTIGGPNCNCSKSELTCANGQCVAKELFCDFKHDCTDGSDETAHCTCADYLKLTMPDRLCNNVRDCLDKSDENSEKCICEGDRFKCSASSNATEICISRDFVCDGELDCPNGEDEKICRGIQGSPTDPRGTGQVLRRSFGIWHSECFPVPVTSTKEISDICRTMNYNSGEALYLENPGLIYGQAMIPDRDEFYMIRLNQQAWISLKKNRPLVKLVVANRTCHRAFVRCV